MDRYAVYKDTGTHADVLAALGAADVLRHLEPRLVNFENRIEIQVSRPLSRSDFAAVDPGFPYLVLPNKNAPNLPPERLLSFQPGQAGLLANHRMSSILRRMKAYLGPNRVILSFAKMARQDWETCVWDCFNGGQRFPCAAPLVQLFNPHAGKGYALPKPTGTNRRDKTKDRWANPFIEWLRFRGYFEGAAGWFTSGDLRFFCPIPGDVSHGQFFSTAAAFRELSLGGTAAKMDCRAILGLTRLLIERAEEHREPNVWLRGVWVTHYKDMGQAHTVISMEQLAIPDWFELQTPEHSRQWLETLKEHDLILRRLDDRHSDEYALLKQYRRTLQSVWRESIPEFLRFLAGYAELLIQRRAKDEWLLPQFSVKSVLPILRRKPDLCAALGNEGITAISAAVRAATFGAQTARHAGAAGRREIRYGLISDIRRTSDLGKCELLSLIRTFVESFNREATLSRAQEKPAKSIRSEEMQAFVSAVDELPDAQSAGMLVCALSSCLHRERALEGTRPTPTQELLA